MQSRKIIPLFALLSTLVLGACAQATPTPEAMAEKPTEATMAEPAMTEEPSAAMTEEPAEATTEEPTMAMTEEPAEIAMQAPEALSGSQSGSESGSQIEAEDPMVTAPAYFSTELTDVRSDESFTIADFKGKVVLVETLAMWCSNCLKQQNQVLELHRIIGERDDFVSLGLDIDPFEDAAMLKDYIRRNGFTWPYAVAPAEVSREIGNLYGDQFLNPPSTPMFIIDRHGQVHPLPFGIKSAGELMEALRPFLEESA
jgi:hypothetical protein